MKNTRLTILLVFIWILSACAPAAKPVMTVTPVLVRATLPPNAVAPTQTSVPKPTLGCPNPDCIFERPALKQTAPIRLSLPTPAGDPVSAWRPPQYPVPLALGEFDHFYLARPIAADVINWPIADYRYGGNLLSAKITHTGVDIPAKAGTPVLASGSGRVLWAGWGLFSSDPDNTSDPYGIAVAIRHDFGYQGQPLFTIYAHLQAADVAIGQRVDTGTQIGEVGDTGYTTGPHLHFEMRLGKGTFYNTRNPELWIAPPQGWGVLAGRVMEANRDPSHSRPVSVRSIETNREWIVNTYGPEAVNSDDYYAENMVISDLPAGRYEVKIIFSDKLTDKIEVTIRPGRVTYFVYRATYGFTSIDLPPAPTTTPAVTLR